MAGAAPDVGTSPAQLALGALTGILTALQPALPAAEPGREPTPTPPSIERPGLFLGLPVGVLVLLAAGVYFLTR